MELHKVTISGFRRFRKKNNLNVSGKLISLLGPNEAGKTSILKAIQHLGDNEAIADLDVPRGPHEATFLEGHYFLDDDDLEAADLHTPTWFVIKKPKGGNREYVLNPEPPKRDISNRSGLVKDLNRAVTSKQVIKDLTKANPKVIEQLSALAAQLDSEAEDLPNVGPQMQKIAGFLDAHLSGKAPKVAKGLSARLLEHRDDEIAPNPKAFALGVLTKLVPKFLNFTEEQRSLLGEYILKDVVGNTPVPLDNLATIGKLNLADLNTADQIKATHTVDELEDAANRELEIAFDKTWSQSEIKVKFRLDSGILKIHIIDEGAKYSSLNERSDGLKQFVALRAFTTRHMVKKPILLVDEAEQHLHYDAQSDLVQMFARQKVA